ncbi:MAG: hypothetical protein ACREJ2_03380 [Planctomycetota bacterium]
MTDPHTPASGQAQSLPSAGPASAPIVPAPVAPVAPSVPVVPVATTIEIDDFKKVRLITAKVLSAVDHPSADKLIVLKLDIGQDPTLPRQICAGIRGFYAAADLVGRTIILVENLKPRKLRGEMSEGMLLAVHDGAALSLLTTDKPVAPGLVVG